MDAKGEEEMDTKMEDAKLPATDGGVQFSENIEMEEDTKMPASTSSVGSAVGKGVLEGAPSIPMSTNPSQEPSKQPSQSDAPTPDSFALNRTLLPSTDKGCISNGITLFTWLMQGGFALGIQSNNSIRLLELETQTIRSQQCQLCGCCCCCHVNC